MSTTKHIEQIHALNLAFAATEQQLKEEITAKTQREQEVAAQLLAAQQQAEQQRAELARSHSEQERALQREHAERETALNQQLQAGQQDLQRLQLELAQREKGHAEQANQTRQELETLLRQQVQREQEVAAQLLAVQQQVEQQRAELARSHSEQERALQREHAERQQAVAQQLQAAQETLRILERDWAQNEKALSKEIAALQQEVQALHHAKQLLSQQHDAELSTKLDEHQRVLAACAALESELKAEMLLEHQASLRLRQSLAEVQHNLDMVHTSLSWRMTAPLRMLASFIDPKSNSAPVSPNTEELTGSINKAAAAQQSTEVQPAFAEPPISITTTVVEAHLTTTDHVMRQDTSPLAAHESVSESPSINIQNAFIEAIMPPPAPVTIPPNPAPAATLDELLAHHDQKFVECAYQTLLGRAPDPEGLGYYLGRIRSGFSKARIISQLTKSREGKLHNSDLVGLADLVRLNKLASNPYFGWCCRALYGIESERPLERKLRALENQVYIGTEALGRRFNQINLAISGVSQLLIKQQAQGSSVANVPNLSSISTPALERISPRATKIFVEMKSKISQNSKKEELV